MHYMTIILELIQQRPEMHERLRRERTLLGTMKQYAEELKARHQTWQEHLSQAKPGSSEMQIASEAMELAIAEMEAQLPVSSPLDANESLTLEAAMAYVRKHTAPA